MLKEHIIVFLKGCFPEISETSFKVSGNYVKSSHRWVNFWRAAVYRYSTDGAKWWSTFYYSCDPDN